MRLFAAIDLSKEVKDYLYNLENELKGKLPGTVRWVSKKNLHLTLKFFGEIQEKKVDALVKELKRIRFNDFKISIEKIGYFGTSKEIHTIWLSVKPENEIIALAQKIDSETLEFASNEQKFTAHLTLGRVNKLRDIKTFKEVLDSTKIERMEFNVGSFKLIQSTLTKDGPQYKILEEFLF